jgi:hypothetical protein
MAGFSGIIVAFVRVPVCVWCGVCVMCGMCVCVCVNAATLRIVIQRMQAGA